MSSYSTYARQLNVKYLKYSSVIDKLHAVTLFFLRASDWLHYKLYKPVLRNYLQINSSLCQKSRFPFQKFVSSEKNLIYSAHTAR